MARILSNNPLRGGMSWVLPRRRSGQVRLSVRRLMKVDPSVAKGTPDNQILVGQNGVEGRSGAAPVRSVVGRHETRERKAGTGGQKKIRDSGVNRSLKRR